MRIPRAVVAFALAILGGAALAQGAPQLAPPLTPQPAAREVAPTSVASPGGRAALTAADVDAWLDGYMPYALHSGDIAGAVVTVVQDGRLLAARGYGYADVAKRAPVDPYRTLFRPGSISKLVTWTAVMQEVEAGRLDLDRNVNTYLDFVIPPYNGQPITLRQLLTHTAGFEEQAKDIIFYDARKIVPLDRFLKRSLPRRIYAPGTTPAYSNYGTYLAGYIVQRASGVPFDDYIERRIFAPLGMTRSTFRQPLPPRLAPFMAQGYPRASEKAKPFEIVGPAAAGAMSAPGADMARFMIAHLQGGRGLMRPETARLMHDSPLARVNPRSLIPPLNRMELGFFETNVNGREVIAHLGDTNNFHSSLHLFLREGVGLYVSFNSAGKDGAAGTLRSALFQDFADRYFPTTVRDGRVDAATSGRHAEAMAGLWQNSRRSESNFLNLVTLVGQTEVGVNEKGELVVPSLTDAGGAPRRWTEIAPFVWRDQASDDRLAAQVVDGKVVRWSFDTISPFMVFDRVPAGRSKAWINPALYASLGVLVLTFLYWPASWYVRRRYATAMAVTGPARRAYRATRVMAGLVLAVLIGWAVFVTLIFQDTDALSASSDPWLWLLQIAGAVVFFGAVGIAGWNLLLTWRDGRGWTRKLWSLLILLATILILYVAWAFGLLSMSVKY